MSRPLCLVLCVAAALAACKKKKTPSETPPAPPAAPPPALTHGVSAGAVSQTGALLWARGNRAGTLVAEVARDGAIVARGEVEIGEATDFTGIIGIEGLTPGAEHTYQITLQAGGVRSGSASGWLTTAPDASDKRAVKFAWSGDLAGQNACRDAVRGFPIFTPLIAANPDFFIALGDMIYADNLCEARGLYGNEQIAGNYPVATDMASFWAHWRYTREDEGYRQLLASRPVYATWDDHEVTNDSGPKHKSAPLLPLGLAAFRHYNPVAVGDQPIHSRVRWGQHLELFFLDNRSHRDANTALDTDESPKTMLGAAQRAWLEAGLRDSDATWQVVVSSVPISIPTGSDVARDGWADFGSGQGFERELRAIIAAANEKRAPNLLWITTDVHFASIFRYTPAGAAPFHEAVVGPMNAGLYPTRDFDDSLGTERLFFHGPESTDSLTFDQAMHYMTFGTIEISDAGALALTVVNADGKALHRLELTPRRG